jgi:hypothetical protein
VKNLGVQFRNEVTQLRVRWLVFIHNFITRL